MSALTPVLTFIDRDDGVERAAPGLAPTAFRIWRAGVNPTDGGDTIFSDRSAKLLMSEQSNRGRLYSLDVDHATFDPSSRVENHKAAGWYRLEVRGDSSAQELWAVDIDWVDWARAGLEKSPPEWRYYSPAYEQDKDTGEVISFVNMAVTNNPRTWRPTTLASRALPTERKMEKSEVLAALKKMAESEGEYASLAAAIMAMPGFGEPDGDDKKDAECTEPDGDDKKDAECTEPDGDEPEKKSDSLVSDARVISLLESIEADRKAEQKRREKAAIEAERKTLLDSVTVLNKSVKVWLEDPKTNIQSVRDACRVLPRREAVTMASATTAQAIRGETQGRGSGGLSSEESAQLDAMMGMRSAQPSIRSEDGGRTFVLGAIDAKERSEILARRAAKKGGV